MKNIFLIYLFSLFMGKCLAQTTETRVYNCPALQQLEGEWKYENGQDQIKIFLRYFRSISRGADEGRTSDIILDALIGWVEYTRNGIIIESNYLNKTIVLPYEQNLLTDNSYSIYLNFHTYNSANCNSELWGTITDFNQSGQIRLVDAQLSNNGTALVWKQRSLPSAGVFTPDAGMTLPSEFTLIKQ